MNPQLSAAKNSPSRNKNSSDFVSFWRSPNSRLKIIYFFQTGWNRTKYVMTSGGRLNPGPLFLTRMLETLPGNIAAPHNNLGMVVPALGTVHISTMGSPSQSWDKGFKVASWWGPYTSAIDQRFRRAQVQRGCNRSLCEKQRVDGLSSR